MVVGDLDEAESEVEGLHTIKLDFSCNITASVQEKYMKVKGLPSKICMINPNSVGCDAGDFDKLKEGKSVELAKEDAEDLINNGMAELVKSSNKEKK